MQFIYSKYGKSPKISYNKVSDEMAYTNSADPDQTAPARVGGGGGGRHF